MSDVFKDFLDKLSLLQNVSERKELNISGFYGSSPAYFFSLMGRSLPSGFKKPVVFIFSQPEEAENFYLDLLTFYEKDKILFFPDWEILPFEDLPVHPDIISDRVSALSKILDNKTYFLVTSVPAIFSKTLSFDGLVSKIKHIKEKSQLNFDQFLAFLTAAGYERENLVEKRGQWSVRGGIVDFFPPGKDSPVRIEFLGDLIESIREFDSDTQKTAKRILDITVLPVNELMEDGEASDLFSYLSGETIFYFADNRKIKEKLLEFEELIREGEKNAANSERKNYLSLNELENKLENFSKIIFQPLAEKNNDIFCFDFMPLEPFLGKVDDLENKLQRWHRNQYKVDIFCDNEGQKERLRELLSSDLSGSGFINIKIGRIARGFKSDFLRQVVFSEDEIFGRYRRRARYSEKKSMPFSTDLSDLKISDYVVHNNHGIGIYEGLNRLTIDGRESDYVTITYEGNDKLYLPVDQIGLVKKYIGSEGSIPDLSKLGGQNWEKTKKKVKEKIATLAIELLEIYTLRQNMEGFAFAGDSEWQREFEASFIYEETKDQLTAIEDIKRDMEDKKPMDRLLCGDVGYGKTEVAMRAAFKAVMDNKQVAVLVPTTLLAEQHFNTFRERMADYPVKIEMLSRFRSASEQKLIIEMLKKGEVNIIIGTHRLIQKDIEFKDLGLVIIDEEHRFGVKHKEQLKKLRKNVDILAMTATPIPRTLHLSLSSTRDISLINTPPEGRFPVKTFVEPYNVKIISMAIRRELNRQGQIFFVHNCIEDLEGISEKIKELCPAIKIGTAHGQMNENELEKVMVKYLNHECDLLLSTTIIESGLDISNANTIIIDHAEDFGLAQLYQLRGRVGRSHHQAYCYLFFDADKKISEEAEKRLQAIFDFTELGSGFKIAMKDLEIRGAGNLLGSQQHGHISEIGFELYCELLKESVEELKGNKIEEAEITEVNLKIPAYFSENYIPDEHQKLILYQRLALCGSEEEWRSIKNELEDRFGTIPKEGENLLSIIRIKILMREAGIIYTGEKPKGLILRFSSKFKFLLKEVSDIFANSIWKKNIEVLSSEPIVLELKTDIPNGKERLDILEKILIFLMKKL
ncbi:MAG: transcription-repair coupling factor [bacterium]|nr:transcription-repair coupling factor [bacterium]